MHNYASMFQNRWTLIAIVAAMIVAVLVSGGIYAASNYGSPSVATLESNDPPGQSTPQEDNQHEQVDLPPVAKKSPPKYPKLDSNLNQIARSAESSETADLSLPPADKMTTDGTPDDIRVGLHEFMANQLGEVRTDQATADTVLVTFYVDTNRINEIQQYLEGENVYIRNVGEDYIEAHIPPSLLGAASEQTGVLSVETVTPPRSSQSRNDSVSQGVGLHGADAWHNAGYRGKGVVVGIIDSGFEGFQDLANRKMPPNSTFWHLCYSDGPYPPSTSKLNDCQTDGNHGTMVAEIVLDIAPHAQIYISNPITKGDMRNTINQMGQTGVTVINHSMSGVADGPGDGTSPRSDSLLRTIDTAVAKGITWINSAGNDARTTWYGTLTDYDNDGWHNFTMERNRFTIGPDEESTIFMRWNDQWGQADCDLDLHVLTWNEYARGFERLKSSTNYQDGRAGQNPFEKLEIDEAGTYYLAVSKEQCQQNHITFQLKAWIEGDLGYYSANYHMGNPAESRNAGMLAVGATNYWNTQYIAPYSSRGPTLDNRTKPDITGVAGTYTTTDGMFEGTSASAPHIAGLAALVKQRYHSYTPQQVTTYLKSHANRTTASANNTWGHGIAALPTITTQQLTAPSNLQATATTSYGIRNVWLSWTPGKNAEGHIVALYSADFSYQTTPFELLPSNANSHWFINVGSGVHQAVVFSYRQTTSGLFEFEYNYRQVNVP